MADDEGFLCSSFGNSDTCMDYGCEERADCQESCADSYRQKREEELEEYNCGRWPLLGGGE